METEEAINLLIKTINNDVYNIRVTNSTPITRLKDAICETTSIERDRQRLIYRGKVLTDESVIRDYNIEDGHTVHMVARPSNFREIQQTVNSPPPRNPATATATPNPIRPTATLPSFSSLSAPDTHREANEETSSTPQTPAEPSLEYIRQGLLTMHTLFSTISSVPIPSSAAEARNENILESKPSAIEPSNDTQLTSERRFFIGQWLDVKDTVSQWLEATVLNIDYTNRRIFVHYNGWPQRWDEWIAFDSPRVAPFRSRTSHPALSSNLSPTPNIAVSHAPATGVNDLRMILPELVNVFRMLQPVVEELGALSEESLRYNQPSQHATTNYARGMPWDHLLQENSSTASNTAESKDTPTATTVGPGEKYMEVSDTKESSISGSRSPRTQQEIDERLQLLTRDACPLFDRFGRLLSDLSPHLWTRAMPGVTRPTPANRFDPFQSLEARLLSLLRERPPSPPPIQSYRAPITSQGPPRLDPMDILRGNMFRGSTQTTSSDENNEATTPSTTHNNTTSNTGGSGSASNNNSANRRSGLEHHLDIHIAILSPPTTVSNPNASRANNVDSLSRTVANLTASLQAQAQHLAARTQELSQRTSAVSEITSAITEALRNNGNITTSDSSASNPTAGDNSSTSNNNHHQEDQEEESDSSDDSIPSIVEPPTSEELLADLNVPSENSHVEESNNSLMPDNNNEDQAVDTPFYNISNRRLQANYGTNPTTPAEVQSNDNSPRDNESPSNNDNSGNSAPSSSSFLQRLRRSFFSSSNR